jgi:hypothetical protein
MFYLKKYKFLFKPLFFIFNLFFATWLVLKIEEYQPSHKIKSEPPANKHLPREQLKSIIFDFKRNKIDSVEMEDRLRRLGF